MYLLQDRITTRPIYVSRRLYMQIFCQVCQARWTFLLAYHSWQHHLGEQDTAWTSTWLSAHSCSELERTKIAYICMHAHARIIYCTAYSTSLLAPYTM